MPGPKHPQPTQVPLRLERAPRRPVHGVALHRQALEGRLAAVGDGVCGGEATEPVADPICVSGPDEGGYTRLDDGGEGGKEGARVWLKVCQFSRVGEGMLRGNILSPVLEKPVPAWLEHSW